MPARRAIPLLVLVTVLTGVAFEARDRVPFTSDQAIVAIMAEDILDRGAHPVFYYGVEYAGTLEPHYLAAVFAVFGASPTAFRAAMALLLVLAIVATWAAARRAFGERAALVAGLYLALGPSYFFYKGLTSDGAYASLLMLSATSLWLMLVVEGRFRESRPVLLPLAALGLTIGLAWWVHTPSIFLAAVLGAAALTGATRRWLAPRTLAVVTAGFLLGSGPWWIRNLETGMASLRSAEMAAAQANRLAAQAIALVTEGFGILLGAQSAWSPEPAFPGATFATVALLLVLLGFGLGTATKAGTDEARFGAALFVTAIVTLGALCLMVSRTDFREPRYLFAGYAGVAPLVGALVDAVWPRRFLRGALLAILLALNLGSQAGAPIMKHADPERATFAEYDLGPITARLRERGVKELYASYWVAYRLSFGTGEEIAASPIGRGPHGYVRSARLKSLVDQAADPGFLLSGDDREDMRVYLEARGLRARRESLEGFALWRGLPEASLQVIRRCNCIPTTIKPGEAAVLGAEGPARIPTGSAASFRVEVRNDSPRPFSNNVHLSYHWLRAGGSVAVWDGERALTSVWPAATVIPSVITVKANVPPGTYTLVFDLVDENVAWFEELGGRALRRSVAVDP